MLSSHCLRFVPATTTATTTHRDTLHPKFSSPFVDGVPGLDETPAAVAGALQITLPRAARQPTVQAVEIVFAGVAETAWRESMLSIVPKRTALEFYKQSALVAPRRAPPAHSTTTAHSTTSADSSTARPPARPSTSMSMVVSRSQYEQSLQQQQQRAQQSQQGESQREQNGHTGNANATGNAIANTTATANVISTAANKPSEQRARRIDIPFRLPLTHALPPSLHSNTARVCYYLRATVKLNSAVLAPKTLTLEQDVMVFPFDPPGDVPAAELRALIAENELASAALAKNDVVTHSTYAQQQHYGGMSWRVAFHAAPLVFGPWDRLSATITIRHGENPLAAEVSRASAQQLGDNPPFDEATVKRVRLAVEQVIESQAGQRRVAQRQILCQTEQRRARLFSQQGFALALNAVIPDIGVPSSARIPLVSVRHEAKVVISVHCRRVVTTNGRKVETMDTDITACVPIVLVPLSRRALSVGAESAERTESTGRREEGVESVLAVRPRH